MRDNHVAGQLALILNQMETDDSVFDTQAYMRLDQQFLLVRLLLQTTVNNYWPVFARRWAGSAKQQVTRAENFIEAHLRDPIGSGDMAKAAGVNDRTLRESFHRIYGMPPEMILRKMRLHAARKRLENPTPQDTLRSIAREFLFTNDHRFTTWYREQFGGESPSDTLLRGRRKMGLLNLTVSSGS